MKKPLKGVKRVHQTIKIKNSYTNIHQFTNKREIYFLEYLTSPNEVSNQSRQVTRLHEEVFYSNTPNGIQPCYSIYKQHRRTWKLRALKADSWHLHDWHKSQMKLSHLNKLSSAQTSQTRWNQTSHTLRSFLNQMRALLTTVWIVTMELHNIYIYIPSDNLISQQTYFSETNYRKYLELCVHH